MCVARQTDKQSSSKLTFHPAVERSGKSTVLTMEHEVDVALILLKINVSRKHHIDIHEKNSRPCLVPPTLAAPKTLRTRTSWHGCVIVAENEKGVSQVYRVSSIKL